jgi:hypothetical protein
MIIVMVVVVMIIIIMISMILSYFSYSLRIIHGIWREISEFNIERFLKALEELIRIYTYRYIEY